MVTKVVSYLLESLHISHLVQVKTLDRQQHWVKNACEQIGLGNGRLKSKAGKVVDKIIFLQVYDL